MSGICGVWAFDGPAPTLGPVLAQLGRRGPEGTRGWSDGPVAFGHTLLATTPEALVERLPLNDVASGCTITADARIDNREELLAALDLAGKTRVIGDGELILRAYLEWGEDCPSHLLGDFAFAIWDPGAQRLFCARDHMGMRQLIYHHAAGKLFTFATEVDALIASGLVPRDINQGRIADFLDNLEGLDLTSTFFEKVFRLPPAHSLIIDATSMKSRRYWTLRAPPPLNLDSDRAYRAAFLEIFSKSVRCRLRSAGPVGILLSGGIDSNAVAAVAGSMLESQYPLRTYSGVGPEDAQCVETKSIRSALQNARFTPTTINHEDVVNSVQELVVITEGCAEPFDAPMTLHRAVYLQAQRDGTKIMLDGVGGDLAFEPGNVVAALLKGRRWHDAIRLSTPRQHSLAWWVAAARQFAATLWTSLAPTPLRRMKQRLVLLRENQRTVAGKTWIRADFARKVDLKARRKRFQRLSGHGPPFGTEHRIGVITHPHLVVGRERYDRVCGALGIEARDPFLDIRLLEFCLSLPLDELQRDRYTKHILRQSMVGLVPDEIIWRHGKEHLGWRFTEQLLEALPSISVDDQRILSQFIEPKALKSLNRNSKNAARRLRWYEARILSYWLARNKVAV